MCSCVCAKKNTGELIKCATSNHNNSFEAFADFCRRLNFLSDSKCIRDDHCLIIACFCLPFSVSRKITFKILFLFFCCSNTPNSNAWKVKRENLGGKKCYLTWNLNDEEATHHINFYDFFFAFHYDRDWQRIHGRRGKLRWTFLFWCWIAFLNCTRNLRSSAWYLKKPLLS